jgi:nucleotide-binding universal stress UspA family protein
MLNSILLIVDDSKYGRSALDYAIDLARVHQARISLLAVVNIRLVQVPFILPMPGAGVTEQEGNIGTVHARLEQGAQRNLDEFRAACENAGVQSETSIVTGIISSEIIKKSGACDLVMMGQSGEYASGRGQRLGSTVESVVRGTTRPVMVTQWLHRPIGRILVPYDGSWYASGALALAAELARPQDLPVVLLAIQEVPADAERLLAEASLCLSRYSVTSRSIAARGPVDAEIVSTCRREQCDLIVMGAYSHSRLRKLFVGSTTARVMRYALCPLVLFRDRI